MEPALFTGTTILNESIRISQRVEQSPHHLIDLIFTEALLRISNYLPEWEVELVNDSETWPDYMAEVASLLVKHVCGG
ncbi:hypothetical protein [Spirosoma endophyticum]|uniref:Uncharacterized protein n=1 Tax=Spirosoma endophyticum TaxID=662367 RepID=A0A1I2HJP1_9BACT|nr:hypothetical protein [Spirosoma endophyticum]SFF28651.1 hypothetical protein SAMN05216167_1437 [Spirosoma endophyticum]